MNPSTSSTTSSRHPTAPLENAARVEARLATAIQTCADRLLEVVSVPAGTDCGPRLVVFTEALVSVCD